jgi:MFS family permease
MTMTVMFEEGGFSARRLQRSVSPRTVSVDSTRGWLVVAVAFLVNVVAFGITYSFGVMFQSLSAEFDAGRGATAAVFSLAMALHFLLGVLTGPAADRRGPRALLLVGAFVMSAGLLFTSAAPTLWIAGLTYGIGTGVGTACAYVPMISTVAGWFQRRQALALGIAVAGVGVGMVAITPLAARLVGQYGVRTTCIVFGVATALLLPACALAAHSPPRPARLTPVSSVHALPAPTFARLYAAAAGFTAAAFVPVVFLAPFAEHHGMRTLQAASLIGVVGIASTTGRLTLGALAGHWSALVLYRACFLGLGLSLVVWLLCYRRYDHLVGCAVLLGAAQGGGAALLPAVTAQLYGTRGLGRILGTLHTGGGIGCLVGLPVAGAVIDLTDGYTTAIALSAALAFASWALLWPRSTPAPSAVEPRGDHHEHRGGRARQRTLPGDGGRSSHDHDDRERQEPAQRQVEHAPRAGATQDALDGGAEREPEKPAGERGKNEQAPEECGLHGGATGVRAKIRAGGAHGHQPRLGIDPLEDRGLHEPDGPAHRRALRAGGRGDLPREPEQECDSAALERGQRPGVPEHRAAEAERHQEHHQAHADCHPEQARQAAQDAGPGAGCRQHHVAGPRGDRRHDGKEQKGDRLLERHHATSTAPGRFVESG